MTKPRAKLRSMAGVLAAMGGVVLQLIRTPLHIKDPNRSEDKLAMSRAEQKRARKRAKRMRVP